MLNVIVDFFRPQATMEEDKTLKEVKEKKVINEMTWDDLDAFKKRKKRKKKEDITAEEIILKECRERQIFIASERERIAYFRRYHRAAMVIQKAWHMFRFKTKGLLKNAKEAVKRKRLDAGELEWKQQIAACTIQLAWRKYARRRLLARLQRGGSLAIHMWDPDMLALKQRRMLELIYGEQLYAPAWHPRLPPISRPYWIENQPSPAALSYNFAIDQYKQPLCYGQFDYQLAAATAHQHKSGYEFIESLDQQIQDGLADLHLVHGTARPTYYSYNMAPDES